MCAARNFYCEQYGRWLCYGKGNSSNTWSRSCVVLQTQRRPLSGAAGSDGSSTWAVIRGAESFLQEVHNFTHLPWWAVILLSTGILRSVITLPLAVHQNKIIAKRELLQPTLKEYGEAIKYRVIGRCRREGLPVEEANRRMKKEVRKMMMTIYAQEGCHPLKLILLPWVQIPLWIVLSFGLRNLSGAYIGSMSTHSVALPSMSVEGALWFHDLTLSDPFFILPVLLASSNIINIEMHSLRKGNPTTMQRVMTTLFRTLSVAMGVVSSQLPAAMSLYWASSSCYGLLQNILLKLPVVRRALGIPQTPSESSTPFQDIRQILQERANKFLSRQRK